MLPTIIRVGFKSKDLNLDPMFPHAQGVKSHRVFTDENSLNREFTSI